MRHLDKEITGVQLFLARQSGHRQHWRKAEPSRLTGMKEFLHLPLPCPFFQVDFECILILDATSTVSENLPLCPLRVAHEFYQAFPLIFFRHNEKDEAISAFVHAPRVHVPLPQARGDTTQVTVVDNCLLKKRRNESLNGKVDMFAGAGRQRAVVRAEGSGRRRQPTLKITLLSKGFEWWKIRSV
jgi:hypothetical protein